MPPDRTLAIGCVVLCACAHVGSPAEDLLRVDEQLVEVTPSSFRLSAQLSRRVLRVPFTRPGDGDRLRNFQVRLPAGGRIEAQGDLEEIVAPQPFDRVELDVAVHEHHPEKDYAPFFPLAGGGVFVYTAQFDLGEQHASAIEYELRPLPSHHVVVPGRASASAVRWVPKGDGAYVSFGEIAPIEEPSFIAVIDSGFPSALRAEARSLLPSLFEHYAAVLGAVLAEKPTVLLSYGRAPGPNAISIKGGTLSGSLQTDVRLGSAREAAGDPQVLDDFRQLLAHEAAHLWNVGVVTSNGPDWVHEGGAELLSWTALRSLGLLTNEAYFDRLSWAASECMLLRGRADLARDPVRARYACGAVIELVACQGERPGVERVWNLLLSGARRSGRYDDTGLFAASERAGASESARAQAQAIARAGLADPEAAVESALGAAGYATHEGSPPPRFARLAAGLGRPAARWLVVRPGAASPAGAAP